MNLFDTNYVPLVKLHMVKERFLPYGKEKVYTAENVANMVRRLVEGADREYLMVISLDGAKQLVGVEIVAVGTLNCAYAESREIFKHAILAGAAGLILAHNHPSGCTEASESDWQMTEQVRQAGNLLGIEVYDHIILGEGGEYRSLRECEQWNRNNVA